MSRNRAPEAQADLLPEYDLEQFPVLARGPGYASKRATDTRITRVGFDPDVARIFPEEAAVNEALRTFIRISSLLPKKAAAR
jgi:hypothetical protein